jgi:endonuclease YncB( thermonuclease family)
MSFTFSYPAEIDSWHDGDTPICHVKMTPSIEWHGVHVRVDGINAPELHDAGGTEARDYASSLAPPGSPVTLFANRVEKYGRFLARIQLADGRDFSTVMIETGHAVAYTP